MNKFTIGNVVKDPNNLYYVVSETGKCTKLIPFKYSNSTVYVGHDEDLHQTRLIDVDDAKRIESVIVKFGLNSYDYVASNIESFISNQLNKVFYQL